MTILVDTNVLLWLLDDIEKLPPDVAEFLASTEQRVFFSSLTIWEVAIKSALWKQGFPYRPEQVLSAAVAIGYLELPITAVVAATVADLPLHHRDPFDRLLVAQAIAMPARLYTADRDLAAYSELVTLVR